MRQKKCRYCKKYFNKPCNCSLRSWKSTKFCSKACANSGKKAPWLVKYRIKPGQQLSVKTQFSPGSTSGEKNNKWKGENASYAAKHMWVSSHYQKTGTCEHCGRVPISKKFKFGTHWSNLSGTYKRDRTDYEELCASCHKIKDLNNKKHLRY